ncbi:CoA-transferase family III domain-containing protein [Mycotypha africana]|uniref:CoA-transferase family III domain-containing protein n=1 Tax=Mycotypha africana TaxID=64632 RepID=UPI0023006512|nr:CoA-transferase family III domain-containing protein [Mycotypha africana]KAI8987615.1 CoA-transferase family III domain-containing protein [Mycotypha africana]
MPLSGINVFEMAGLAPAPFAGLILADFGANVIRIDKTESFNADVLNRNKRSIALDLKNKLSIETLLELFKKADVLLDPYRPGVMEKLGLGPDTLLKNNPRLIYARLSGYGQSGSTAAGHDINYLAISGALSFMGRKSEAPFFPANMLADFAGGGLMCVMGILMALFERTRSGLGQVIDANLTAGTAYLATFPYLMQKFGLIWEGKRGSNMLDGGAHFYETYQTKDGLYMAVGAIEPQFYAALIGKLGLDQATLPNQMDRETWPSMKKRFQDIFLTKTQSEWTSIFEGSDACVTPVLSFNDTKDHTAPPQPAPILHRTPAIKSTSADTDLDHAFLEPGKNSMEVLLEFKIEENLIRRLLASGALKSKSML